MLPAITRSITITGACNDGIFGGRCLLDGKAIGERAPAQHAAVRLHQLRRRTAAPRHAAPPPPTHTEATASPVPSHPQLSNLSAGRLLHVNNIAFFPSFFVTFQNIRFTGGHAATGLGGVLWNQGMVQVCAVWSGAVGERWK